MVLGCIPTKEQPLGIDELVFQKVDRKIVFDPDGKFEVTFTAQEHFVFIGQKFFNDLRKGALTKLTFCWGNGDILIHFKQTFHEPSSDVQSEKFEKRKNLQIKFIPDGTVFKAPKGDSGSQSITIADFGVFPFGLSGAVSSDGSDEDPSEVEEKIDEQYFRVYWNMRGKNVCRPRRIRILDRNWMKHFWEILVLENHL